MFNDQWELVGLHHSGVSRRDDQGRILSASGQVWQEAMGEDAIAWVANEGARVSRIVRHLRSLPLVGGQAVPAPGAVGRPAPAPVAAPSQAPPAAAAAVTSLPER